MLLPGLDERGAEVEHEIPAVNTIRKIEQLANQGFHGCSLSHPLECLVDHAVGQVHARGSQPFHDRPREGDPTNALGQEDEPQRADHRDAQAPGTPPCL